VINELEMGTPDWVEFFNHDDHAVAMAGWRLLVYRDEGSLAYTYVFPTFTLQTGAYVVLHEGHGTDGPADLYTGATLTFPWGNSGSGAAALTRPGGRGADFVRWGASAVTPPAGTGWSGANPAGPAVGLTLGRDASSTDTDHGRDWSTQLASPGTRNLGPLQCVRLTTVVDPPGAGTISVSAPPNCPSNLYAAGTQLTLTANCGAGYAFVQWLGDLSGSVPTATLTMSSDKYAMARFAITLSNRAWMPVVLRGYPPLPTPTATAVPTPTGAPTPTATPVYVQLIRNPGFETDEAWELPHTVHPATYSFSRAHTGWRSMCLGIPAGGNVYSYSSAQQAVDIPEGVTEATLTFHYWPVMAWPDADRIYFCVLRASDDLALQTTVWTDYEQSWHQRTFDLSSYAGQRIKVHVGVRNDGLDRISSVYLDDVELWVRW